MRTEAVTISVLHELLVEMFIDYPGVAADLLGRQGAPTRTETSALSTTDIAEQRADVVIALGDPVDEIVIVEVQTSLDRSKPAAWATYAAVAARRWKLSIRLLVLTVDSALAEFYARPFRFGCVTLIATVIGPRELADHARRQDHADVSTMMAAIANPDDARLGIRALNFSTTFDSAAAAGYYDLITQAASPAVLAFLEDHVRFDPSKLKTKLAKDFWARHVANREEGRQEGREEGLRSALYTICTTRELTLEEAHHGRLAEATSDTLERWIARAITARDVDAIFV